MFNRNKRIGLRGFDSSALEALKRYDWPGNVRELKNLVQRMVVLHPGKIIGCADLPEQYRSECPEQGAAGKRSDTAQESHKESGETRVRIYDFKALVARFEEKLIRKALRMSGGNKKEAAELLSLKRTTFLEKLKKRNIS
jgi:DNA-binding NtrC family response regulator